METTTTKKIDLTTSIRELPFPKNKTRIIVCLHQNDVNTLGELLQKSREDLKSMRNLGMASINPIEDMLEHFGLSLRDANAVKYVDRLALTPQDWEQRRYEVAKAILPQFINPEDPDIVNRSNICDAIDLATTFIDILKESSEMEIEDGTWK